MTKVRLHDIAELCGVSESAVSRALAGRAGVRSDLRARILKEAKRLGYPVDADTQPTLRVLLSASEAAMQDHDRNQFTWLVLDGLRTRAESSGIEIIPHRMGDGGIDALREAMESNQPDGLLLLTVDGQDLFDAVHEAGWPAVLINSHDARMHLSSISPCNRSAARLATEHLIDLGHRDIAMVLRPGRETIRRRREGWRDALEARGCPAPDHYVLTVADWLPELADEATSVFLADPRSAAVTAVFCAADSLASGVLAALARAGRRVPEDVSVISMDNIPAVEFLQPRLTTVHIPSREIGAMALDMIRQGIDDPASQVRRVELACRLVVRESTAPRARAFASS